MKRIVLLAGCLVVIASTALAQQPAITPCETCSKRPRLLSPFAQVSWSLGLCEPIYICDQRFRCKSPLWCSRCGACRESSNAAAPIMPPAAAEKATLPNLKQVRAEPETARTTSPQKIAPEEQALLRTLRTDTNEEQRRRAALELGRTGSRSFEVLKTLNLVISGSDQDGHGRETSPRVKDAALTALQQCLAGQRSASARPTPLPAQAVAMPKREPALLPVAANAPPPATSSSDIVLPMPPPLSLNPFRALD